MNDAMSGLRAAAALLLLMFALGASAHTGLSNSAPADGEVLDHSPDTLLLEFPEPVRLVKVELRSTDDAAIDLGNYRVSGAAASFQIALPPLASASYRVEWVVMGGDSHKMSGVLGFTVDAG